MSDSNNTMVTNDQSTEQPTNVVSNDNISTVIKYSWDPLHSSDWDEQIPSAICLKRIQREIQRIFKDPLPGIFIVSDPDNMTKIHALVVGPSATPYEGGFFYFIIRCPPNYPFGVPRCRLITTGNNTVRFNPNLYRNGKVCLSIIHTMKGPSWSPALGIPSLLISIQSLMSENPYYNEPGLKQERRLGDSKTYKEIIQHETLRVAVCEMLENSNSCPQELHEIMIKQFFEFYNYYINVCKENTDKNDQLMMDPFGEKRGSFQYSSIITRLRKLKNQLEIKKLLSEEEQKIDSQTQKITNSSDNCALTESLQREMIPD
ncbi:unnamed protein product [Rotaria sp. Silwood1]|nr:unnamed protein product [Rotaria sp. Silwood1]